MGVLDEIEAVERARARGEPMGGRLRRRVAIALLPLGIGLALLASWASAWHVYDFDVVGIGRAQVRVGLWDIEACPERGDCEPMPRAYFVDKLGVLGRTSDAALADWLDARWQVGIGLFLSAAAAAVLVFCIAATQPFKLIRRLAIGAFAVGAVTLLLTLRSVLAEAVDFLGFGIAVYLAFAALLFLLAGSALIAFTGGESSR
jgi:hypothetical protein